MIDRTIRWIKSAAVKDGYLYCVNRKYSILFRINLQSWELEKIVELEWDQKGIVTDVYEMDGHIICVPLQGVQAAVYDPDSREIQYVKMDADGLELIDVVIYDCKIWFVPRNLPGKLYYYSPAGAVFAEDRMWEEEARRIELCGRIKRKCYIEHNQIYLVIGRKIAKYDFEDRRMTELINPLNECCADFIRMGEVYYCISENDKRRVLYWNVEDGRVFWEEGKENSGYVKLTKAGEVVLLDTVTGIDILIDGKIKKWERSDIDGLEGANFINAVRYRDRWILPPWGSASFIECSSDFTGVKRHEIKIPVEDIPERETLFSETEISLDEYIAHTIQKGKKPFGSNTKKRNGQVIYDGFKQ